MYLRTTQRRNKDGSVVGYVQLAHNRRVEGITQAEVLVNLGREDALDRAGLVRLVASINRYLGEPGTTAMPTDAVELVGDGLTVTESRPMGAVHLLDGLWRTLGVDTALGSVLGPRRFTTDMERVFVRAGRQPRHRPGLETVRRGVGQPRCGDPRAGDHG